MSISDAFAGVIPPAVAAKQPAAVKADIPADEARPVAKAATRRRFRDVVGAVVADLTGSWLWDAHGLTVRSLWEQRIPAIEQVPGENTVLRAVWTAFNHAMLLVLVPLLFTVWVLCHPARLLYVAPVAAPLIALWINR